MNSQIKALIFDFDGLLVNTEELRWKSFEKFLARQGKKFDINDYHRTMFSDNSLTNTEFLKKKYKLKGKTSDLQEERRALFKDLFETRLAFLEGVSELLGRVKNWPVKKAIASMRRREQVVDGLTRLGVIDIFSAVVTFEDLEGGKGKPDPEIFLVTSKKLRIKPANCLVFEDAPHGVDAAKAAGMRVIYVPDGRFVDTNHKDADMILKSMHELTDEVLNKLYKG